MRYIGIFGALVFILTFGDLQSVTIVNHHPDEEYFLDHEVLYEEAIAEAKKMEIYPGIYNFGISLIHIKRSNDL